MAATVSAREIAFLALLAAKKDNRFIADTLEEWIQKDSPSRKDSTLAREIAYGCCRMSLALDFLAAQCATSGKLSLKAKEKVLLHTALYQHLFLERVPLYAIVNETLLIAHKYCHSRFVKFLNAALRKLADFTPQLPQGNTPQELSIRHSLPLYFVTRMLEAYGRQKAIQVFEASNAAAPTVFRCRSKEALQSLPLDAYNFVEGSEQRSAKLLSVGLLEQVAASSDLYIQNATPTALLHFLQRRDFYPQSIVDMCASPGGKLLLAHDLFPAAQLHANDVSSHKIARLQHNCVKYGVDVSISCGPGQEIQAATPFDLVVLDVPCTNAGVLNKRPEARWRFTPESVNETISLQKALLAHAAKLLAPQGEIWYLTCSILPEENEQLVAAMCSQLGLAVRAQKTILPHPGGWDGGFGCALVASRL